MGRKKRTDSSGVVYLVTFPNGKHYVGVTTTSFEERKRSHLSHRNTSKYAVHHALQKYLGKEVWEVIDSADTREELEQKEKNYIKEYRSHISENGYNLTRGGDGVSGYDYSPEQKLENSKIKKAFFSDEENRAELSRKIKAVHEDNPHLAREHSEFQKRRFEDEEERKKVADGMRAFLSDDEALRVHSIQRGAKEFSVYEKEGAFVGSWLTLSQCARDLDLNPGHISHCLKGKRKSHKGFVFIYR